MSGVTPLSKADQELDNKKWEAAYAVIRAYNSWNQIQKEDGPFSQDSRDAEEHYRKCYKRYRRLAPL